MRIAIAIIALLAGVFAACGRSNAPARTATTGSLTVASMSPTPPPSSTRVPDSSSSAVAATATPVSTNTSGDSGIDGVVLAGPTCPVERVGDPCPDRPIATTIGVFADTSETDIVAQTSAGQDGRFHHPLAPGVCTLRGACVTGLSICSPYPRIIPQTVTVTAGGYTSVTVHADTGIR